MQEENFDNPEIKPGSICNTKVNLDATNSTKYMLLHL